MVLQRDVLCYTAPMSSGWSEEFKGTLALGGPMALAQLAQIAMNFTDSAMVGRLDDSALAGMAVGHAINGFLMSLGIGLTAAVNPLAAQAHGAGREHEIHKIVGQGLLAAAIFSVLGFLILLLAGPISLALGHDPAIVAKATGYVFAVSFGLFPALCFFVFKNAFDAVSRPRVGLAIAVSGALLNIPCNYALMFGKWGFPALGVTGTGLATTLVNLWIAVLMGALYWFYLGKPDLGWDRERFREVLEVGLPIAGVIGVEVGLFVGAALLMGRLGVAEAAAHQIALTAAATTFMIPLGLGMAVTVRVGQKVGGGRPDQVAKAGWSAVGVALVFMSLTALLYMTRPLWVLQLFLDLEDPRKAHTIALACELLYLAGIFQIFDGLQVTAIGALRGLKDVNVPLAIGAFWYWGVGLTSAIYLAFYTPMAHRGVWMGFVLGLLGASVSLAWRFYRLSSAMSPTLPTPPFRSRPEAP